MAFHRWNHYLKVFPPVVIGPEISLISQGGGAVFKCPKWKCKHFTGHTNSNKHLREELLLRGALEHEQAPRKKGTETL